ncbi:MAG TPA: hypothetical protein VL769_07645 [Acidimicrobiia bacterium]|nr:hypothetical protein [Acidimicrobiia bacterium]
MTTTGGRGDVDLNAPNLGTLDGDDIEVIPEAPSAPSRGRMRAFLVGAIVVVLAAAAITIALINRDDTGSPRVSSIAKRAPSPTTPPSVKRPRAGIPAKTAVKTPVKPRVSVPAPTVAPSVPNIAPPPTLGTPAVTPTVPTTMPTPSYPPSVLSWQSAPSALTIKAGTSAAIVVTVTNPTDGNVTLGQPLSCAPVLRPEHGGAAIGGGVCVQMAQVMSPLQTLTQRYRIYATSTGDASGSPLAPGRYTARFENLHSIPVTVTAA